MPQKSKVIKTEQQDIREIDNEIVFFWFFFGGGFLTALHARPIKVENSDKVLHETRTGFCRTTSNKTNQIAIEEHRKISV